MKRKTSSDRCKKFLNEKIKINMHELKGGKFKTVAQAIAISYAQIRKKHPSCKFKLTRSKSNKSKSKKSKK